MQATYIIKVSMSYNKKVKRKGENFNVFYLAYFQSVISTCDLNNIIIIEIVYGIFEYCLQNPTCILHL